MWCPTVLGEIPRLAATCLLAWPRAIRRKTSTSRSVSPAGRLRRARAGGLAGGGDHRVDLDPPEPAGVDLVAQRAAATSRLSAGR